MILDKWSLVPRERPTQILPFGKTQKTILILFRSTHAPVTGYVRIEKAKKRSSRMTRFSLL
jgi:hypothetical protein